MAHFPSSNAPAEPERRKPERAARGQRILVVAPQPFYADRGTPIATRYLIRALVELGYEIDVLTYPFGGTLDISGVGVARIPNPLGVRGVPIGFSWSKLWLDSFLFSSVARCLGTKRYACVSAVEEAAFVAAIVAPRFGVPVLYDMQSSLAEQLGHMAPLRNTVSRSLLNKAERWLFEHVDLTMTSAGLADRVRNAAPRAAVREWRYPGLEESPDPAEVDRLRAELGLDGSRPVVLYAGNFAEYQGLAELAEAIPLVLARTPNAVFVLVGGGSEHEVRYARRLTSGLPDDAVHVLAREPRASMPNYFGLADVLVSPRQFGGNLPLKVLDYMGAGGAIVATDIPAHRTVLEPERAVLVAPDPPSMASGITELIEDADLRGDLRARVRDFAEENLGWIGYVLSVGEVFATLCGDEDER